MKNILICENCKKYFVEPKKKCSCGSTSLSTTHYFNLAYAENIKSKFLKIKDSCKEELLELFVSTRSISGVAEEDLNEIYVFERTEGSNFVVSKLKDKTTYSLNWERFELV